MGAADDVMRYTLHDLVQEAKSNGLVYRFGKGGDIATNRLDDQEAVR